MLRLTLSLMAVAAFSSSAMAHPEPKTPTQKAQTLKMPTQADLAKARAQMPDFNAIFDDMGDVMKDGEAREGMTRSMDIMKSRVGNMKDMKRDNGKPDFNLMMDNMLGLMGDEEFMGGFMGVMAPMQEVMEKHAPKVETPTQKRMSQDKIRRAE